MNARLLPVVEQIAWYQAPWDAVPTEWKSRVDAAARTSRKGDEMSDRARRILLKQIALADCDGATMRQLDMIREKYATAEDLVRRPDLVHVYDSMRGVYNANTIRRAVERASSISATQMGKKDLHTFVLEISNKDDRKKGSR